MLFVLEERNDIVKVAVSFLNLLSKRVTIWFVTKLQFFLFTNIKLCFEAEIISRAFNARLGTVGTFFMFTKTRKFWQKAGGFDMLLNFKLHVKTAITEDH